MIAEFNCKSYKFQTSLVRRGEGCKPLCQTLLDGTDWTDRINWDNNPFFIRVNSSPSLLNQHCQGGSYTQDIQGSLGSVLVLTQTFLILKSMVRSLIAIKLKIQDDYILGVRFPCKKLLLGSLIFQKDYWRWCSLAI